MFVFLARGAVWWSSSWLLVSEYLGWGWPAWWVAHSKDAPVKVGSVEVPNLLLSCRVSSVLNRNSRQFGKKHLFDQDEETCWNSDQVGCFHTLRSEREADAELQGALRTLGRPRNHSVLLLFLCWPRQRHLKAEQTTIG